jgi:O-antigen ligase
LTVRTLRHFAAVVLCFYLGWLVLGRLRQARGFWLGLLVGFVISVGAGVLQKYGGLEATREFVEQHEQTHWVDFPAEDRERMVNQGLLFPTAAGHAAHPEFLKRLQKGRVFGTFAGYPNALAGAILLLFPAMLVVIWREFSAGKEHLRTIALALVIYLAVGCLIWSGSKSGWLIALGMGVLALLRLPLERKLKIGIVAGVLVVGGVGFAIKYADYFRRGATSVGARVDCWQVAMQVAKGKPLLGTGPGTFGRLYSALKRPDAEMAHLAHNDYLEQASDSGWIGFLAYLAFLPGGLLWLWRGTAPERDWLRFAVWLGLVGWAVQGVAEFGLYIPSLAWIGFLLLGWLWGSRPDGEPEARPARR